MTQAPNLRRALIVAAAIFVLDRISKHYVVEVLGLRDLRFIEVVDPFFNLTMAWNRGINFGLFDYGQAGRWILIGIALAIVAALLFWVRGTRGWAAALGCGAIVGGALGNVWDRLQYGAVADFVNMSCCSIRNPFAFNLADAAIFLGAVLLLLVTREPRASARRRPRGRRKRT